MKYFLLFVLIALSIYSCGQEIKSISNQNQNIDTTLIINNSLVIKKKVDSLIYHKKTTGGIACGFEFSYEEDCDSTAKRLKNTLYYYPTTYFKDGKPEISYTIISSYFDNERMVLINIKHSTDNWRVIKFEKNVYFQDSIRFEEDLIGNFWDLPTDVQELIGNTL